MQATSRKPWARIFQQYLNGSDGFGTLGSSPAGGEGKHKYHSVADRHTAELMFNSLSHAAEDEFTNDQDHRVRARIT